MRPGIGRTDPVRGWRARSRWIAAFAGLKINIHPRRDGRQHQSCHDVGRIERHRLNVEEEVQHVAFLDDVILAFLAQASCIARAGFAAEFCVIVE